MDKKLGLIYLFILLILVATVTATISDIYCYEDYYGGGFCFKNNTIYPSTMIYPGTSGAYRVPSVSPIIINGSLEVANNLTIPNGRVGIGTVTPNFELDVIGNINASGSVNASEVCVGTFCMSQLNDTYARLDNSSYVKNATDDGYWLYADRIGIGTATPTTELEVSGTIKATEIEGTLSNETDPIFDLTLDDSLVSWWRMDDINSSGGVVDYTGRNNGTVVNGAVQTDAGYIGKGFGFDGTKNRPTISYVDI